MPEELPSLSSEFELQPNRHQPDLAANTDELYGPKRPQVVPSNGDAV